VTKLETIMLDGGLNHKDDKPIIVVDYSEENKQTESNSFFSKATNLFSTASSLYSGRFGNNA
jgi:hypothetical protein